MDGLLKFITCGSVDDGKSTLIGHILYDSKLLYTDQEKALELDSKVGSREGKTDYSLLLDGLMAEREQGITIDVAYRYFTTGERSFIAADTPGHEEYTRNMAVGASFAELAIILVDASQGVLVQTRRHARICALMGIRYFVFAINKMDLVSYSEDRYDKIKLELDALAKELDLYSIYTIPVSATEGDNVTKTSENTPWYDGLTLLKYLETVNISAAKAEQGFHLPIQRVSRPDRSFRGFQGQIENGLIRVGDEITALPSKEKAVVTRIINASSDTEIAGAGEPVTITLNREVDVSRGCVLEINSGLQSVIACTAEILWMDDIPLDAGKEYLAKIGTKTIPVTVTQINYKTDVNSGEKIISSSLSKNELASCEIKFSEKIIAAEFAVHRTLGELILIDRISNMTSACGVITKTVEYDTDSENDVGFNTLLIHSNGFSSQTGSTLPPIYQSSSFAHDTAEQLEKLFNNQAQGYTYSRIGNPTVTAFEEKITAIENGISSIACASGMAALTNTLLGILQSGDEIISAPGVYGGTIDLFRDLESFGIKTVYAKSNLASDIEKEITDKTRVIFAETLGNPKLDVIDIKAVSAVANSHGLVFAIDNTSATAYLVSPIKLGADIVINSSSKYINGSSNSISGVITDGGKFKWTVEKFPSLKDFIKFGKFAFTAKLRNTFFRNTGACLSPQNAFYNLIGVQTLGIRMERQCQNALRLAVFLDKYNDIEVNYPGLPSSKWHDTAKEQFDGKYGALVTIRTGSKERAFKIINSLKLASIVSNIGDTGTLVIHPSSTISAHCSAEEKAFAGVYDDLIRISVGIEDIDDIIADFKQAISE